MKWCVDTPCCNLYKHTTSLCTRDLTFYKFWGSWNQFSADAKEDCISLSPFFLLYQMLASLYNSPSLKEWIPKPGLWDNNNPGIWISRLRICANVGCSVSLKMVPATVQKMNKEIKKQSQDHLLNRNWLGQREGSSKRNIKRDVGAGNFTDYLLHSAPPFQ